MPSEKPSRPRKKYTPEILRKARVEYLSRMSAHRRAKFLADEARGRDTQGHPTKMCYRCGYVLRTATFNKNASFCRSCTKVLDFIYTRSPHVLELRRERQRLWRDAHPGWWEATSRGAQYTRRRELCNLPVGEPSYKITLYGLLLLYGNICLYCNERLDLSKPQETSVDHIIPVSHPDCVHDWSNLLPVHRHTCNSSKKDKSLDAYLGTERANEIRAVIADAAPRYAEAEKYAC